MAEQQEEEYYENINYRELLKLQPDNFYLHLPFQMPIFKWFFEARLQMLLTFGLRPNYFGLRHMLDPQAQWFSDWVFISHYENDLSHSPYNIGATFPDRKVGAVKPHQPLLIPY